MKTSERTLLIAVCSIIIIVIVVVILGNFLRAIPRSSSSTIPQIELPAFVDLFFNPQTLSIPKTNTPTAYQTDISVNTHGTPIASVQIELTFDPHVITSFSFQESPENIFSKTPHHVQLNFVDLPAGRASFAEAIDANGTPQLASGPLVSLLFTVNQFASSSSKISFLQKSQVTTEDSNVSILGKTDDFLIEKE